MLDRVYLSDGERSNVDEAMFVLARLPYLSMLEFAAAISGDADKIANAIEDWEKMQAQTSKENVDG